MGVAIRSVARGNFIIKCLGSRKSKTACRILPALQLAPVHAEIGLTARCVKPHPAGFPVGLLLMRTRAGCIRRPDRRTGSQSSTSEPHSGKSANMMIMVAHAAGILRRHQDFLPNLTCVADEGRAKFFRPVYFRCPSERAPVLATCADCRGHALWCGRITPTSRRPAPL